MTGLAVAHVLQSYDLGSEDREALNRLCSRRRSVPARKPIISEGKRGRTVHAILEGLACRARVLPEGGRQIISLLVPGDLTDYDLHLPSETDHAVTTITACTVVDLAASALEALVRLSPRVGEALHCASQVESAMMRERIVSLGRRSAEQRLAHLLCETHARLQAVGLVDDASFNFALSQEELADTLGLSNVHVNRQLKKLRDDSLVQVQDRRFTIRDISRLRALSGFQEQYLQHR